MSNFIDKLTKAIDTAKTQVASISLNSPVLSSFEESLNDQYIGCFRDNPTTPKLKYNLGTVKNQLECIHKGKESGLTYVALQNGTNCYGDMDNKFMSDPIERKFCDVSCSDQASGKCGGLYSNQGYLVNKKNIEKFSGLDNNNDFYTIIIIIIALLLFVHLNIS